MTQNRKSQQGIFIGVFALAILVVIGLAISFMSNRVNELLVGQSQMISGKQAYWSAYSGIELLSGSQLADASNTGTKTYSFSGGTITIEGEASAALYNGRQRTDEHTVTGADGNSSRQIRWVLENPVSGSALFLKNSNTNQNTDWVNINSIQSEMEMNAACDQTVEGHNNETDCDAGATDHGDNSTGHFKPTRYVDGNEVDPFLGGYDECGICGGDGLAEGFDCDGNQLSLFNGLIPEDFSIHSIYPNPFNPVTNITYGLPEHVNVQIIVYDLSGRQVETLLNQFQTPGYHSVNWDADNLPSGVYFVKMIADNLINTQKVLLLK